MGNKTSNPCCLCNLGPNSPPDGGVTGTTEWCSRKHCQAYFRSKINAPRMMASDTPCVHSCCKSCAYCGRNFSRGTDRFKIAARCGDDAPGRWFCVTCEARAKHKEKTGDGADTDPGAVASPRPAKRQRGDDAKGSADPVAENPHSGERSFLQTLRASGNLLPEQPEYGSAKTMDSEDVLKTYVEHMKQLSRMEVADLPLLAPVAASASSSSAAAAAAASDTIRREVTARLRHCYSGITNNSYEHELEDVITGCGTALNFPGLAITKVDLFRAGTCELTVGDASDSPIYAGSRGDAFDPGKIVTPTIPAGPRALTYFLSSLAHGSSPPGHGHDEIDQGPAGVLNEICDRCKATHDAAAEFARHRGFPRALSTHCSVAGQCPMSEFAGKAACTPGPDTLWNRDEGALHNNRSRTLKKTVPRNDNVRSARREDLLPEEKAYFEYGYQRSIQYWMDKAAQQDALELREKLAAEGVPFFVVQCVNRDHDPEHRNTHFGRYAVLTRHQEEQLDFYYEQRRQEGSDRAKRVRARAEKKEQPKHAAADPTPPEWDKTENPAGPDKPVFRKCQKGKHRHTYRAFLREDPDGHGRKSSQLFALPTFVYLGERLVIAYVPELLTTDDTNGYFAHLGEMYAGEEGHLWDKFSLNRVSMHDGKRNPTAAAAGQAMVMTGRRFAPMSGDRYVSAYAIHRTLVKITDDTKSAAEKLTRGMQAIMPRSVACTVYLNRECTPQKRLGEEQRKGQKERVTWDESGFQVNLGFSCCYTTHSHEDRDLGMTFAFSGKCAGYRPDWHVRSAEAAESAAGGGK